MSNELIIAIDGPAASGKGTVASSLAKILNLTHLPTGNLYRLVAKRIIDSGNIKNLNEEDSVPFTQNISLDELNNPELHNEEVAKIASIIASMPKIREALIDFQRNFPKNNNNRAVLEGRDIGTVILPNCKYKFFITASVEERARRRFNDLIHQDNITYESVLAKLKDRDLRDSQRSNAPMKIADDAIVIDTTNLSKEEAINKILDNINISL